jgi:hypothetical protein
MTLLARETLPPISLSPALLRWSSARTPFPLFAPLAPAPGETLDSRVSSGPGPEVLYAACQPQHSPLYGIQSADLCIPRVRLNSLQITNGVLRESTSEPNGRRKQILGRAGWWLEQPRNAAHAPCLSLTASIDLLLPPVRPLFIFPA